MKASEIKVGGVYTAKVSDRVVPVRIDSKHSTQGWNATNTKTGKRVHIKSAQRLRAPVKETPLEGLAPASTVEGKAQPKPKATKKPSGKKDKPAKKAEAASTKMSALDAAAQVLDEAGEPLNTKTMIERMAEQGLWVSPGGKTPEATLYSAILRDMKQHGDKARFRKAGRGLFESTVN